MELRDYQLRLEDEIRDLIRQGYRRILVQLWMGGGKTVLAADIIRKAVEKATYTAFLAHRRELVRQASDKLERFGVPHGLIMAGEQPLARRVQVCSIQTLYRRAVQDASITTPHAGLVFIDEAHHAVAQSYQRLMEQWPDAVFVGLTATPATSRGYGLGNVFDAIVQGPTISEMMEAGWLVEPRYFAPSEPDLEAVTIRQGDYATGELEDAMDQPSLVGDVVTHFQQHAAGRPTVVFATWVQHAIHLAREFQAADVRAEVVHGKTDTEERDEILGRLAGGELDVVVNCQVLTEGWDCPEVSCCVLARPTKSLILYLQMVGRVLRPAEGKEDAIVLDHAGAVYEHGFVQEFEQWELDSSIRNSNPVQERRRAEGARPITCQDCLFVYSGQPTCPNCGAAQERHGQATTFLDGYLGEVSRRDSGPEAPEEAAPDWKMKRNWFLALRGHAFLSGYKDGWAYHAFQQKFGEEPEGDWWDMEAIQPSDEVRRYAKYLQIRRAKSRHR
ncbi:MAG TPA: DEAD/DEAH box helicase [Gammaproteobacteria bacterium]|nr:DEAD/DEAH box helicase [Gammaproteobacteria bacterium]